MDDYFRKLTATMCVTAALAGQVAAAFVPAYLAAAMGVWIGLLFGATNDQVGKQFRTDVDPFLMTPDALEFFACGSVIAGMLVAAFMSDQIGVGLSAAGGLIAVLIIMRAAL